MTVALGLGGPHACGPWAIALPYRFLVTTAFGPCVGAAYMPPAETVRALPVTGSVWCLFCIVGRGLDPAANGETLPVTGSSVVDLGL